MSISPVIIVKILRIPSYKHHQATLIKTSLFFLQSSCDPCNRNYFFSPPSKPPNSHTKFSFCLKQIFIIDKIRRYQAQLKTMPLLFITFFLFVTI